MISDPWPERDRWGRLRRPEDVGARASAPARTPTHRGELLLRRAEHRDTTVQAGGEDVVGWQGHKREVVMGIDGDRVRATRGLIDRRNNLDQRLALCVDDAEHGAGWIVAGAGVVPSVTGVEPDFVGSPNSRNPLVDGARLRVHNNLDGRGGLRIRRSPRHTGSIEDHTATQEQILARADSESGRLAEL